MGFRFHFVGHSVGIAALFACLPAFAQVQTSEAPRCATGHRGADCLAAFAVDLDGDQEPDQVSLVADPRKRLYYVVVYTHSGRQLWPFAGSFDPKADHVTLAARSGGGDLRCRNWAARKSCGYPVWTHDVPRTVLYLSDSKRGDFVLYIPQPYGHDFNADGIFRIMPALDGPMRDMP